MKSYMKFSRETRGKGQLLPSLFCNECFLTSTSAEKEPQKRNKTLSIRDLEGVVNTNYLTSF